MIALGHAMGSEIRVVSRFNAQDNAATFLIKTSNGISHIGLSLYVVAPQSPYQVSILVLARRVIKVRVYV